ncbi:calcium/calmodulin-dependent 3',5'-cyclic nucleotide phosphodiesterase 1C [Pelomyxa schiedti]|nr:calcium/calmodulin-dependent 3',5'-cyclic nucleotide phosphodiesterase 1C [Pelomyxa schiedti]
MNKDDALSAQETALVKVIVLSSVMGCVVFIVSISTAIYMAVKKQYSHLSNKVADLHLKLEEAEHKISQLTTTADEVTVTALTSGLDKVTTLIARLVDNPGRGIDAEDVDTLKLTQMLLMTRNFTTVKLETDLTENQHQFILDCGMQVDEKNVFGKARRTHSKSALRSQARSTNTSLSDFSKSMEEAELPSNMDDDIPSINDWSFDVFSLEDKLAAHGGNILGAVGYKVLAEQWLLPQFHPTVKLDVPNFFGFTSQLKRGYSRHPNPYHNFLHAADVTQAMNVLLQMATQSSEEFASCLSPLDEIACVLAALSHDYRHPGLNSNFLKSTMDAIYVKYGDSVLERMHAATSLKVLFFRNKCCALRALSPDDQHYIHTVMMSLILATDMAKHIDILETMKSFGVGTRTTTAALFSADPGQAKSAKLLVLQVLMKIADLSNVCRDWPVCKKWTYNLVEEFKGQGEQEKRHGIPTSKFMDGSTTPQEMQNTFIPLIVIPLLKAISGIFPNFQVLEQRAWENLERWRTMASFCSTTNDLSDMQPTATTAQVTVGGAAHNWDFLDNDGGGVRVKSFPFVHNWSRYDLLKSTSPTVWSQLMAFLMGTRSSPPSSFPSFSSRPKSPSSSAVRLLALQGQSLLCFMWDTLAELLTERVTALRLTGKKYLPWECGYLTFGLSPLCGITSLGVTRCRHNVTSLAVSRSRRNLRYLYRYVDGRRAPEEQEREPNNVTANWVWLVEAYNGSGHGECGLLNMKARQGSGPCAADVPVPQYCGMNLSIVYMCFDQMEPGQMSMVLIDHNGTGPTVVCVVVDVEHSVSTSSLDICSSTTCVMPVKEGEPQWELRSTLVMRRSRGHRVFVVVRFHNSESIMFSVTELEEGTGLVREIGKYPKAVKTTRLSESTFCVFQVINGSSYQIWDCSSVDTRMVRVVTLPDCGMSTQIEDGFIYLVGYSGVTVCEVHTGSPIFNLELEKWSGPLDFPLQIVPHSLTLSSVVNFSS